MQNVKWLGDRITIIHLIGLITAVRDGIAYLGLIFQGPYMSPSIHSFNPFRSFGPAFESEMELVHGKTNRNRSFIMGRGMFYILMVVDVRNLGS